jgi:hypothetical protein
MTIKMPPPSGLGAAGRELWEQIATQLADDGLTLDSREARFLRDACFQADDLARIEAELDGAELTVRGSQGQPVANSLLSEATRARTTIATLLARLELTDPAVAASTGRGSRTTSTSARRAAMIRHHGAAGMGA